MSAVIEKTISVLPTLLTAAVTGRAELLTENKSLTYFHNFMKKCKNLSTKHEEESFISKELQKIKQNLSSPDIKSKAKRECLLCVLYCHMLGYDVTFAYIHAVKQAQQGNDLEKRSGYLLCALLIDENSDLSMLLVNTIQKDIQSSNMLDVCTALTSLTHIVRAEMIPALLPLVQKKLDHQKGIVRKKCVLCLWRFHQLAPDMMEHSLHVFEKAVCDRHPSVVWAAVGYFTAVARELCHPLGTVEHMFKSASEISERVYRRMQWKVIENTVKSEEANPGAYKHMAGTVVQILKQIIQHTLPPEYNFQGTPAPWLSIHILKLLAQLGKEDRETSSHIYEVLNEILQRTEANSQTGLAVIYECLLTISAIYPEPQLLSTAAKCVSRFLSATNVTLKYLGIKALSELVRVSPRFAMEHQSVVMECLEHSDYTVQKQAYDMLYGMANPKNLHVISGKLLERLAHTDDQYVKESLAIKLLELCDRFENNFEWYIRTMNEVLIGADEVVTQKNVNKLLEVIFSSSQPCKNVAVRTYWMALNNSTLCEKLLQVAIMTVCEYWQLLPDVSANEIVDSILTWLTKSTSALSQRSAVLGLQKVLPLTTEDQRKVYLTSVREVMQRCNIKDRQIIREIEGVCSQGAVFSCVPKAGLSQGNPEFDFTLSFLDDYVLNDLENGGQPYMPPRMRSAVKTSVSKSETGSLKFEAYDGAVSQHSSRSMTSLDQSLYKSGSSFLTDDLKESVQLKVKKNVWGKDGYNKEAAQDSGQSTRTAKDGEVTADQLPHVAEAERQQQDLAKALFEGVDDGYPLVPQTSLNLNVDAGSFSERNTASAETESDISNDMKQLLQSNLTENFYEQGQAVLVTNDRFIADAAHNHDLNASMGIADIGQASEISTSPVITGAAIRDSSQDLVQYLDDLDLGVASDGISARHSVNRSIPITNPGSERRKETLHDAFRNHKYANLKENFDVDSLDGSPDKETPPIYFAAEQASDGEL